MKKFFIALISVLLLPLTALAADKVDWRSPNTVTDWYIHEMNVEIQVKKDSSLTTKETIQADVGTVTGKHGIFVVLPTRTYLTDKTFLNQPVSLTSITNENGVSYKYESSSDPFNHTVTWKIGDADKEVTGHNTYVVTYDTRNAISFHDNLNELYWDVLGNQWELPVDNFSATVTFPEGFDHTKGEFNLYGTDVTANWSAPNVLTVNSTAPQPAKTGITISATQPLGLFTEDSLNAWWNGITWLILPAILFILLYRMWQRYGQDPTARFRAIAPEFDVPDQLDPLTLGMVYRDGTLKSSDWSAGILYLAVNGYLTINEEEKKGLFGKKSYTFTRTAKAPTKLSEPITQLLTKLFDGKQSVTVADLNNKFYTNAEVITASTKLSLVKDGTLDSNSGCISIFLWVLVVASLFSGVFFISTGLWGTIAWVLDLFILITFATIMPRRTEKGWLLFQKIKGFKLYMDTAEKYRQRFFEEQSLWERLLPYAILFGLTNKWNTILKDLMTDKSFRGYTPAWWLYGGVPTNFNIDSFTSSMESVSSAVGSSLTSNPSSSGSGGGGFAGGGGGGGGGGGW